MAVSVSIYKNNSDTNSTKTSTLEKIFEVIQSDFFSKKIKILRRYFKKGELDKYKKGKNQLEAFTSTGIFSPSRKGEYIQGYTHIITLDIDKIPDQIEEINKKVNEMPETLASFLSPSGVGLKVFVKIDTSSKDHKAAYNIVRSEYEKRLNIKLDDKTDDIARLCYISYDPNLYYNLEAKTFMASKKLIQQKINRAIELTEKKIKFERGSRNTYINTCAFYCNLLGVPFDNVKNYFITSGYIDTDFDSDEIIRCLNSAYKDKNTHT